MTTKIPLKNYFYVIFILMFNCIELTFSSEMFDIKWSIISQSGGFRHSKQHRLFECVGFTMIGAMSSQNYQLSGGKNIISWVHGQNMNLPQKMFLNQNFPNPFNPVTRINFELEHDAHVKLDIFNILGQKVKTLTDANFEAGYHYTLWDAINEKGEQVGSGTFILLIKITGENGYKYINSKKMVFLQ